MKERGVVANALRWITPVITYSQDEVIFTNPENREQSVTIRILKGHMPNVKRFLSAFYKKPIDMHTCIKELEEIPYFLPHLTSALGDLDWMASSPTEKRLKLDLAIECLREKMKKARITYT